MARSLAARLKAETPLFANSADLRVRALERLYLRRTAVDDLIRSLESYEQSAEVHRAPCVSISVGRKWSS
jgi:hypothetical protein